MRAPQSIIKRPILTEKSTWLRETGGGDGEGAWELGEDEASGIAQKVVFEVSRDANKVEIRNAIQKLFNVTVTDVHTMIVRGKVKRIGRFMGRRANTKKAIVTLKAGDSIEFFEGV